MCSCCRGCPSWSAPWHCWRTLELRRTLCSIILSSARGWSIEGRRCCYDRHLLAAIQIEGELQQSVLAGLDDYSRKIYDQGGFLEPHLTRIILSTWDLPEIPEPPTLDTTVLSGTVVEALFAADALPILAGRCSAY